MLLRSRAACSVARSGPRLSSIFSRSPGAGSAGLMCGNGKIKSVPPTASAAGEAGVTRNNPITLSDPTADRWFYRVGRLMTTLHEGCWLDCLSANHLNAVTAARFGESQYYASTKLNLSGFFNSETTVLDRHFRRGSRILDAAAGAGREVLALRKAGFEAEGFESSLPLPRANQAIFDRVGQPRHVIPCAPRQRSPGPATYAGLIVGWAAYTHIPTKLWRIVFLQALRQRALPNSPGLIPFFTRSGCARYENLLCRTATILRLFLRVRKESLDPGDHLEWSRYVYRFTRDEVDTELRTAGFRSHALR